MYYRITGDVAFQAAVLLGQAMEEVSNHRYTASGTELICADDGRRMLSRSSGFGLCSIENGYHLFCTKRT